MLTKCNKNKIIHLHDNITVNQINEYDLNKVKKQGYHIQEKVSIFRITTDLIVTNGLGVFFGYKIDDFFHTTPIFIILCTIVAIAASMLNIHRSLNK